MQLLHFTQIALYAFLTMYLLGGNVGGLTNLLCSHNEIRHRGKEAGPRFIYLIFYGLFFCNCSICFFSCGWCDDVVVDIWQTVLDALKLVVMCNCVRLWGSGLCITGGGGSRSISFRPPSSRHACLGFSMKWNWTCSLVCINLLNRHVGGGHFVWQPQEEQDTQSENASVRCPSLSTSSIVIDSEWCWPSRAPYEGFSLSIRAYWNQS